MTSFDTACLYRFCNVAWKLVLLFFVRIGISQAVAGHLSKGASGILGKGMAQEDAGTRRYFQPRTVRAFGREGPRAPAER